MIFNLWKRVKKSGCKGNRSISEFLFQNYISVYRFYSEFSVLVDHIALLKSALWKGDGAGVEIVIFIAERNAYGDMCVTVEKNFTSPERRGSLSVMMVTVRSEYRKTVKVNICIVRKNREIKHHLVDIGVAVSSDGEDFILVLVKQSDNRLWRVGGGQVVSRSVIKQVTEYQNFVAFLLFRKVEYRLGGIKVAVNVRADKKLHGFLPGKFYIIITHGTVKFNTFFIKREEKMQKNKNFKKL